MRGAAYRLPPFLDLVADLLQDDEVARNERVDRTLLAGTLVLLERNDDLLLRAGVG